MCTNNDTHTSFAKLSRAASRFPVAVWRRPRLLCSRWWTAWPHSGLFNTTHSAWDRSSATMVRLPKPGKHKCIKHLGKRQEDGLGWDTIFFPFAHPCWPRPAAGRQGPDGQNGGRGRLWSSEGRTGRQAEPPGVSPQTACSEPQACKSQSALPRWINQTHWTSQIAFTWH